MPRFLVSAVLAALAAGAALVVFDVLLVGIVPGLFAHLVVAVMAALGFCAAAATMPELRTPRALHVAGLGAGVLCWAHAMYVVLPALGFTALPSLSNATLQLTAHALVYGVGLAGFVDARLPRLRPAPVVARG